MGCLTCNDNNTNNNKVPATSSKPCYESKYTNKTPLKRVKKNKECCEEIDLNNIKKSWEWSNGICVQENNLNTGFKRFDTLIVTSKEVKTDVIIPLNANATEVASLAKLSLKQAIDAINVRSILTEDCRVQFCNTPVNIQLTKDCPLGFTTTPVTYSLPPCSVISTISQDHANLLATQKIELEKFSFIQNNGVCTPEPVFCNEQQSITKLKSNCLPGFIPSQVPYTIPANTFCSSISLAAANQLAVEYMNNTVDTFVENASPIIYCGGGTSGCNELYSEVLTKNCFGTLVEQTYTVPAGKYCVAVTESKPQNIATAEANNKAVEEVQLNRESVIANIQCVNDCGVQVFGGNIRNTDSYLDEFTFRTKYRNPTDYTIIWDQGLSDFYETQPVIQVIDTDTDNNVSQITNRFRLELFKNGIKIIDSQTLIQDNYINLIYSIQNGDTLRYLLTFENDAAVPETVAEATQLKGCPPAAQNLVTKTFNEGDGI